MLISYINVQETPVVLESAVIMVLRKALADLHSVHDLREGRVCMGLVAHHHPVDPGAAQPGRHLGGAGTGGAAAQVAGVHDGARGGAVPHVAHPWRQERTVTG